MTLTNRRTKRLVMVMAIAVILWIIGTGFYRDILAKSDETYKGLRIFADIIDLIEKNYVDRVETKELIKNAIEGMVRGLDPHSSFLQPDAFKELRIDTHGEFTGVGISITMRNGFITVISPIEGTPAYRAGVKAMDKIIKVDGKEVTDLTKAVKMIRGPKGSAVVITIAREGSKEPIEFKIVRDVIPIESVRSLVLKPGFGYVWITNFRDKTTEDLIAAMEELESDGAPLKGLILDLRDNPGGLLDQAISVSDLFLKSGKILSIKGRLEKHTKIFTARDQASDRLYPMVVLINGGSASASEIVAGALQDHKRALILGATSFGKGSVQTVESLRDGYGLKITIARYYTPSGRSIQAKGIEPDVIVKRRFVDEKAEAFDEGLLKEKDLKDHLEEEPGATDKNGPEPESKQENDDKDKQKKRKIRFRHGPPTIENLQDDHQVMRALEILISYEIFKGSTSG